MVVTAAIDPLVQETTIELAPTDGNETILTFSVKLRTRRRWLRVPVPPLPLFFMLRLTIGRTVRGERKRIESLVR